MRSTVLALGFFFAVAGVASAAPQSIGDCEKIADPDGYNRCLAAFGPAARPQRFTNVPTAENPSPPQPQAAAGRRGRGHAVSRRGRGGGHAAGRRGRVRMEINVGGSRSKGRRGRRH